MTEDDPTPDTAAPPSDAPKSQTGDAGATIAALQAEIDEFRDRALRALAEAENTRKRAEKDLADTRVYSVTAFARDMISVADNLSRALSALSPDILKTMGEAGGQLVEGVELTERELLAAFERHGVARLAPEAGDRFDPNWHQAAAHLPSAHPSGSVALTMQAGWRLGERALRPAIVAVSSGPASVAPGSVSSGSATSGGGGSSADFGSGSTDEITPGSRIDTKV